MKKLVLFIIFLVAYSVVSNDDYEAELQENAHWCQMIEEGTWYAGQDEIEIRCNS